MKGKRCSISFPLSQRKQGTKKNSFTTGCTNKHYPGTRKNPDRQQQRVQKRKSSRVEAFRQIVTKKRHRCSPKAERSKHKSRKLGKKKSLKSNFRKNRKNQWSEPFSSCDTLSIPIITRSMSRYYDSWKECLKRGSECDLSSIKFPTCLFGTGIVTRGFFKKMEHKSRLKPRSSPKQSSAVHKWFSRSAPIECSVVSTELKPQRSFLALPRARKSSFAPSLMSMNRKYQLRKQLLSYVSHTLGFDLQADTNKSICDSKGVCESALTKEQSPVSRTDQMKLQEIFNDEKVSADNLREENKENTITNESPKDKELKKHASIQVDLLNQGEICRNEYQHGNSSKQISEKFYDTFPDYESFHDYCVDPCVYYCKSEDYKYEFPKIGHSEMTELQICQAKDDSVKMGPKTFSFLNSLCTEKNLQKSSSSKSQTTVDTARFKSVGFKPDFFHNKSINSSLPLTFCKNVNSLADKVLNNLAAVTKLHKYADHEQTVLDKTQSYQQMKTQNEKECINRTSDSKSLDTTIVNSISNQSCDLCFKAMEFCKCRVKKSCNDDKFSRNMLNNTKDTISSEGQEIFYHQNLNALALHRNDQLYARNNSTTNRVSYDEINRSTEVQENVEVYKQNLPGDEQEIKPNEMSINSHTIWSCSRSTQNNRNYHRPNEFIGERMEGVQNTELFPPFQSFSCLGHSLNPRSVYAVGSEGNIAQRMLFKCRGFLNCI